MSLIYTLPVLLALIPSTYAQYCYDRYGYRYRCNNSGLSYGARIGIGLGVAVAVLAVFGLCGYWRRRQIRNQFSKYRPPTLPTNNTSGNPYANNPPPPSNWNNNSYNSSNLPPPPPQTYQPSMAGQYGNKQEPNQEHGYEWEQAREQERLEREQSANPPGYDMANSAQNTGNSMGYAPPPGAPPRK